MRDAQAGDWPQLFTMARPPSEEDAGYEEHNEPKEYRGIRGEGSDAEVPIAKHIQRWTYCEHPKDSRVHGAARPSPHTRSDQTASERDHEARFCGGSGRKAHDGNGPSRLLPQYGVSDAHNTESCESE